MSDKLAIHSEDLGNTKYDGNRRARAAQVAEAVSATEEATTEPVAGTKEAPDVELAQKGTGEATVWVLEWGDSTNQVSGQWNHEEHDSSEKALDAAKTKIAMGLIAHAIHSAAGVLWMSGEELLDSVEAAGTTSQA